MPPNDAYTDVVELCALLQCLGFSVKSLDTCDNNNSQDGPGRSVVINCQSSGLNVVLESDGPVCSCPATNKQNSGVWQVSGVTGGKQLDKEFGCTLLGSLPKEHRERLSAELQGMIRCIKQFSGVGEDDRPHANKSASMIELSTPEKRLFQVKVDTPTRYRSLDTLTTAKEVDQPLPAPGPLHRGICHAFTDEDKQEAKTTMCRRQSTYTLSSTPGSMKRTRNKTSSPIQSQQTLLDSLISAERTAEELKNKIAFIIREFVDDGKNDSSISSLALDVSKISVLKGEISKAQFASSPNLSALGAVKEEFPKSRLNRFESASTSNLAPKVTPNRDTKSKLRRLSPNIFKLKKDSPGVKTGAKATDAKSKLNSMFKPKIVTPIQTRSPLASPNLSASKRKFSHVKSTIPRPMKKE
ncbi:uncharacterized protein LOC128675671 isoform X2 [Plodia interpunctella]|uniref:uncharacterized protein LOC128675671 isoform X2 n=1 Tax=Plodia interpunctella TaxID=58824 RepID=UPI0023681DD5|nr:uncharacterized protein LOC128675671 isoform X2 [Plodia interpunctella]